MQNVDLLGTQEKVSFDEFAPISKEKWFLKVLQELSGKDFDKTINWHPESGQAINPIYTAKDSGKLSAYSSYEQVTGNFSDPAFPPRHWKYLESIGVSDIRKANQQALLALNNGADGIIFKLDGMISHDALSVMLRDIEVEHTQISFQIAASPLHMMTLYRSYLNNCEIDGSKVKGGLLFDCSSVGPVQLAETLKVALHLKNFSVVSIQEVPQQSVVEQSAQLLLQWANLLNERLGDTVFPKKLIAEKATIYLKGGNQFFLEIARMRALRFLLTEMTYREENTATMPQWNFHFETHLADGQTPNQRLFSNTGQALSAILAGCQSLSICLHDDDKPGFSSRIARNISNLIREESYLDKTADPVAGSYYIENVTDILAKQIWNRFQELIND